MGPTETAPATLLGRRRFCGVHPQANIVAKRRHEDSIGFWLAVIATGVLAGFAGGLLMRLLHLVQHLAWSYDRGSFLDAVQGASPLRRILVVAAAGAVVGVGLVLLRLAKGGHAGELTVAIWFRAGEMPVVKTLVRAVLSIAVVAMGAAVGREGALKQTGAVFAQMLGRWRRLGAPERRLLTACGAGGGLAAAYNLPIGGALFAMEVLLGTLTLPVAAPALACSIIATATSWLLLPDAPTYQSPAYALDPAQLIWAALAGALAGAAALGYIRLMRWAVTDRPRGPVLTFAVSMLVFAALGASSLVFPELLGNGRGVVQRTITGQFGPWWLLIGVVTLRPFATALCLKSGAPGGLFTPTMTIGALLGQALGRAWSWIAPGALPANGSCAVIAAGAFLAACTGGPISTLVIMLELGRHVDLLVVPAGVAIVAATVVIRIADAASIYTLAVADEHESLAARPPGAPHGHDAPAGADPLVISAASSAVRAVQKLMAAGACTAYVIDEKQQIVGRIDPDRVKTWAAEGQPPFLETARDLSSPLD